MTRFSELRYSLYDVLGVWLCGVHVRHFTEADWTNGRGGHCHHHSRQRARLGVEAALKNVTSTGAVSLLRVMHFLGCTGSSPVIRCCHDSHRLRPSVMVMWLQYSCLHCRLMAKANDGQEC